MDLELLIQTLVPKPLGKWVKAQAEAEGISVAAWVRRLIMQEQQRRAAVETDLAKGR